MMMCVVVGSVGVEEERELQNFDSVRNVSITL